MINNIYKLNYQKNKKIALLSDLHISNNYCINTLNDVIKNLNKNKPDYICIVGDILEQGIYIENIKIKKNLKEFIIKISLICPVILVLGNHDISYKKHFKVYPYSIKDKYNFLNELKNVYLLDNSKINLDNINFIGVNLPFDYYYEKPYENYKNYQKNTDMYTNYSLNILLCHSPIYTMKMNYKTLKNVDIIFSGHMHNGLIPPIFEKLKTNRGIISPYKKMFPIYARGNIVKHLNNHKVNYIISGGITKLNNRLLNLLFKPHIEYIII